jgi:hypothetical protein
MAVKAINNITSPNGLVSILLVFRAYPRLIELDPLNTFIKERAIIIKKAIKAL